MSGESLHGVMTLLPHPHNDKPFSPNRCHYGGVSGGLLMHFGRNAITLRPKEERKNAFPLRRESIFKRTAQTKRRVLQETSMQVYKTHYRGLHVGKNHYICVIKHPFLNLKAMNKKPTVKNRIKNKMLPLVIIMLIAFAGQANAQLPSYRLKNISGKTVDTSTLASQGRPFIISFFATWCKPCIRELTAIAEVYQDWQTETGVTLYAVSIDKAQNANKVKPLVDLHEWPYEVLLDVNGDFRRSFGGEMIPFVIVCDPDGKIVYRHSGYTEGSEEELITKIRELPKK